MARIEEMLASARVWSEELEGIVRSRSVMTDRAVVGSFLATGVLISLIGLVGLALDDSGRVRSPWPLVIWGGVAGLTVLYWRRRSVQSSRPVILVATILTLIAALGPYINGTIGLVATSTLYTVYHIVAPPNLALGISVLSMTVLFGANAIGPLPLDPVIGTRVFAASITAILLLQMIMRHVARVNEGASHLGKEVAMEIARLDAELRAEREAEAERARIDASTGFLSEGGVGAFAAGRFSPDRSGEGGLVLAVRLERWEETLRALTPGEQGEAWSRVAVRLRAALGDDAAIARTGASEFLAILDRPERRTESEIRLRMEEVLQRLDDPVVVGRMAVLTDPTLGYALWPDDGPDLGTCRRNAELARSVAAELGVRAPSPYQPILQARIEDRVRLGQSLRDALEQGEFELHYQPIAALSGGPIKGAEALLRWRSPERGLVPPAEFLGVAQSVGLMPRITEWVLAQAARDVREFRNRLHPEFRIGVNLPPDLLPELAADPGATLSRLRNLGAPLNSMVFELTESTVLSVDPRILGLLRAIREEGGKIAMDDFGTGQSTLERLDSLPLDILKVDRSFVEGIETNDRRQGILRAVVTLGKELGLLVVVEGVETPSQFARVAELGADRIQGYLVGPPIPIAEIPAVWNGPAAVAPATSSASLGAAR